MVIKTIPVSIKIAWFLIVFTALGFHIIKYAIIVRIDIEIIRNRIGVPVHRDQTITATWSFLISIIQSIPVCIDARRCDITMCWLSFDIIQNPIIIRIYIQIIWNAIIICIQRIRFGICIPIQVGIFVCIYYTIIVIIYVRCIRYPITILIKISWGKYNITLCRKGRGRSCRNRQVQPKKNEQQSLRTSMDAKVTLFHTSPFYGNFIPSDTVGFWKSLRGK